MENKVISEILAFLFGRKYYANIINTRGTAKCEITSFIFPTKEVAEEHKRVIEGTATFLFVETIAFRSRKEYF